MSPSVTEARNVGTNKSPYGVPLSVTVCACGGAGAEVQALNPNTTATTVSRARTAVADVARLITVFLPSVEVPLR